MVKRLFCSSLAVLSMTAILPAQQLPPEMLWRNALLYGVNECCHAVQQMSTGGYIIAGFAQFAYGRPADFYMARTDAAGNSLWQRHYGGVGEDNCWSAQITMDGGYILAGETSSYGPGGKNFWLVKTNADGDSLWSRTFGGNDNEVCYAVKQTQDGGYLLAGYTTSFGAGNADFWLVKTNEAGDTLWTRTYGGATGDTCHSVQQTEDGGYILAGTSGTSANTADFRMIKTDVNGNPIWSRTFGGPNADCCNCVQQTSDGGYALAGSTASFGMGYQDFWLIKTDADGDSLWSQTFGGSDTDVCNSMIETWDYRYLLAGWTCSYGDWYGSMLLVKMDTDGDTLWSQKYFPDYQTQQCYSVHQTADGGFILGGFFAHWEWEYGHSGLIKTTRAFVGATIELMPHNPPLQIPPGGGSFQFDVEVENFTNNMTYRVDLWVVMTLPDGSPYPTLSQQNISLPPGVSLSRPNLTQFIPGTAMAGIYHYTGYVADHNTYELYDQDSFTFVKLPGEAAPSHRNGWQLWGWSGETEISAVAPTNGALLSSYPNPFNPTTALSYELRTASHVSLKVYNLTGRLVATLMEGWQKAGIHKVTFDGSQFATGIYFASLKAECHRYTEKIILLK